ncbi:Uncharacterised protein [Vibrio cholerae]|nr:Uncharacterised protein [Vibrio cholerae]CSD06008.1 Uncharacterised protein [Vibrio cholerae]CSD38023.1 Uncharacterised protein [Vibrio cholerae]
MDGGRFRYVGSGFGSLQEHHRNFDEKLCSVCDCLYHLFDRRLQHHVCR